MASINKKPRSKYWFACFRDLRGKQRRLSTKETNRKKAIKVAEQYETDQPAQGSGPHRSPGIN